MTDDSKRPLSIVANDSMTIGHLEKALTVAHYQQQLQNQQPAQVQSTGQTTAPVHQTNHTGKK